MDDSRQLEREAEATRNQLELTLGELRERITPGQLVDQALEYVSESGGGDFVRNLGRQAAGNPLPICLIGAGLAWFALSNGRSSANPSDGTSAQARASTVAPDCGTGGGAAVSSIRSAKDQVAEGASSLATAANNAVASTSARAGAVADTLGAAASRAAETGRSAADTGWDLVQRVADQPLVLAGIGVAIGAALGAALPSTEVEDQLIGDASDRLKGQARSFAKEQYEKGQELAQDALQQAAEDAGDRVREGLGEDRASSAPAENQDSGSVPPTSEASARS